jgi:hypothetical protein
MGEFTPSFTPAVTPPGGLEGPFGGKEPAVQSTADEVEYKYSGVVG